MLLFVRSYSKRMAYYTVSGRNNVDFVNKLHAAGVVTSEKVMNVMKQVDRGNYCTSNPYFDSPQPIGHRATISAPHMHAMTLELLEKQLTGQGKRALDVGSGSGYLSAALALMVGDSGKVVGIDYLEPLVELSIENLKRDGRLPAANLEIRRGDGWLGAPDQAPFDAIHVGAAASSLPQALVDQLALGGRMVIPVGPEGGDQYLLQVDKDADGKIHKKIITGVRYVPLVKENEQKRSQSDSEDEEL